MAAEPGFHCQLDTQVELPDPGLVLYDDAVQVVVALRRVWAPLWEGEAPDGICVDAEGAVWYACVPGRHCVRVAEGGSVLATVNADRRCFSCTFGGDDGRTLVVVANTYSAAGASDGVVFTA